ncbi:polyphosphate kinase 2 family protein [Alteromonas sp. BMJM2]|uniref:polyphosphate kinase 2 family protein n=1 Tax=Alteromonas sp. BMJM2 TaxID=2954241 RepID=UPI0022B5D66F|nr:polyphosphate kinase [Alteromonas sp. BMJM2]
MQKQENANILTLQHEFPASRYTDKETYKAEEKALQEQLFHIQQAYFHQNRRALIVFEGWDASGKGGAIRRVTEKLDPRGVRVIPVAKPDEIDQAKHFLYRFWHHVPAPGNMTIFDRSHYGRVLVERVDQLASDAQWQRGYREINEFEETLHNSGVRIVKLFMHISAAEQRKRFEERLRNPYKRWKLTAEDLHNSKQRNHYINAINDMFNKTNTPFAPWKIIDGEHKWQARVDVLRAIVERLSLEVNIMPPPIDEALLEMATKELNITDEFSSDCF